MKPAREWAMENAPVTCQATARAAFEAGVRAFAEHFDDDEEIRATRKIWDHDGRWANVRPQEVTLSTLAAEFLAGKEAING